jgi:ABC-type uncharacterized transport system involved in gliding motility auxiliary subunit
MTKRQASILTFLSVIVILLALLISGRLWARFDLTKNKAYTISDVSRNLHNEIPDQVRITYYISDKLKAIHPMPGEIEDLLREYAAYSRGKIRLAIRDPSRAKISEEVESLGIMPQQVETVEQDQSSIATVYTGIAIDYLDKTEVLPVVFALDTLEYDLTSRIHAMVRGTERQLGVIVGDISKQWNEDYALLDQAVRQAGYGVRVLQGGEEIPDTLSQLLVLGGAEELDPWALYRIDRYIQGGGKVFFALGGVYVDVQGGLAARKINDRGLLAMLASWGAEVKPALALDRSALRLQYETRMANGAVQVRIVPYPHWLAVLTENGNREHPVSARFEGVDLYWPSPVEIKTPPGIEGAALFTTTNEAWLMSDTFDTNPETNYFRPDSGGESTGTYIMAASLSGVFPSWFKDRPKPEREGAAETLPDLPKTAARSRIIVTGNADMFSGFMQLTGGTRRNLNFLLQALDWLGNDEDIIGIRSRQSQSGRLDKITSPAKRARLMRSAQVLNVGIMPLLVITAGLFLSWKRRKRNGL